MSNEKMTELTQSTCLEEQLVNFIVKFFNNDLDYKFKKQKHKNQKEHRFLVCFDNAEELIIHRQSEFQEILAELYDQCPTLSIIITSNKHLYGIQGMPSPIFRQYLKNLRSKPSVELFMHEVQKAQALIYNNDIVDLIIEDENYPIKKILPEYDRIPDPVTEGFKQTLSKKLGVLSRQYEALSYHDLFKQLSGNPSSIVILAACYSNPFHNVNSLTELYKRVLTNITDTGNGEDRDDISSNLKATISKNNMSLTFTTEASIKLLEESAPKCLNLLYFLGCLPGGLMLD